MKKNSLLTLLLLSLAQTSFASRILTESETPPSTCNPKILATYGLEGNFSSIKQDNHNCPDLRENCCSSLDGDLSQQFWRDDASKKINAYYHTYLFSLKYVLGFVEQANELAEEMLESPRAVCKKAGESFKKMGLTEHNTTQIFTTMAKALRKVSELRRGFYCNLCDAEMHAALTKDWEAQEVKNEEPSVKVSMGFCENLVEKTVVAAYFEAYYVKEISELMSVLVACGKNIEKIEQMTYELPVDQSIQVKNCFFFRNRYFFYFCSSFCEQFNLARASGFFDGNLEQLRKFIDFFKEHRKGGFPDGNKNFLMDVGSWEEEYLQKNLEEFGRNLNNNELFFVPKEEGYSFDRMELEVMVDGGIDPFDGSGDSLYSVVLTNSGVVWRLGVLAVMLLLVK